MKLLVVGGCSFTTGYGLNQKDPNSDYKESPDLWINLCHKNIEKLSTLELKNVGQSGASNTEIFENLVSVISRTNNIELVICGWTSMPRYNFNVGFELYDTSASFNINRTHGTNKADISGKYIQDLVDRLKALHHYHWEILKLLRYINILEELSKRLKFQILHVNLLCPWDNGFFDVLQEDFLPSELSEFTRKEILNVDSRDDEEIFSLYKKQHQMYFQVGGIQKEKWINLYNSFGSLQIDTCFDDQHPGIESNQIFYKTVKNFIET